MLDCIISDRYVETGGWLKATDVVSHILEIMAVDGVRETYGTDLSKVLIRDVLGVRKSWCQLSSKHWSREYSIGHRIVIIITLSPLLAFQAASLEEVTSLIQNGKIKTSNIDPLPSANLKANTSILAPILRSIINLSYESSTVPASMKHAVITPLLKRSGLSADDYSSYRPISNLPYASKLPERHVSAQLRLHLQSNDLEDPFQSAYR